MTLRNARAQIRPAYVSKRDCSVAWLVIIDKSDKLLNTTAY